MTTEEPKAVAHPPGEAKAVSLGKNLVTFLARREDTAGIYSLTEFTVAPPPTPGPPLHIHKDAHEAMYVLEGELIVTLGEHTMKAPSGSFVYVPRGMSHTLANPGPLAAKILIILTPPGYEGSWEEMAQHLASGTPPDPALVLSLQQKYHLETGGQVRQFSSSAPEEAN
jgi:mannose-6-phosphate isomerase-like protein (cupin superfamily)